jgi:hypothetical protein
MRELTDLQMRHVEESRWDLSGLRALFINCTLKRSPDTSHTQGLADLSIAIMDRNGVSVDVVRAVDCDIATGVWPDMTEHGWERDEWPAIFEQVLAADILVLTTPIWLGEKSSVCTRVIDLDPGSGGPQNDFTNRNTTFMTWNLLHLARMLGDAGGVPAHGNQRSEWDAGCRFDFANPDYR